MLPSVFGTVGSSPLTRGKRSARDGHDLALGLIPAHAGKTSRPPWALSPAWAHPHSRGENYAPPWGRDLMSGSSPLMRGKPQEQRAPPKQVGLIPAHAGKTVPQRICWRRCWAHPRSCGENNDGFSSPNIVTGSSPLMRGKRRVWRCLPNDVGLIPAHAGKTRVAAPSAWPRRAHPRSCGENVPEVPHALEDEGSSPLMRGKRSILFEDVETPGLIPAHAGKTSTPTSKPLALRAHPHSCGENVVCFCAPSAVQGSSPLTRGKLVLTGNGETELGLIPAHAGKTRSWLARSGRAWAHPRSHGENPSMPGGTYVDEGSSPLTRGKPAAPRGAEVRDGLIPAHAGKTRPRSRRYGTSRAHPHSRGENGCGRTDARVSLGSSPLTRGKPSDNSDHPEPRRLIPTHAGKRPLPDQG